MYMGMFQQQCGIRHMWYAEPGCYLAGSAGGLLGTPSTTTSSFQPTNSDAREEHPNCWHGANRLPPKVRIAARKGSVGDRSSCPKSPSPLALQAPESTWSKIGLPAAHKQMFVGGAVLRYPSFTPAIAVLSFHGPAAHPWA